MHQSPDPATCGLSLLVMKFIVHVLSEHALECTIMMSYMRPAAAGMVEKRRCEDCLVCVYSCVRMTRTISINTLGNTCTLCGMHVGSLAKPSASGSFPIWDCSLTKRSARSCFPATSCLCFLPLNLLGALIFRDFHPNPLLQLIGEKKEWKQTQDLDLLPWTSLIWFFHKPQISCYK